MLGLLLLATALAPWRILGSGTCVQLRVVAIIAEGVNAFTDGVDASLFRFLLHLLLPLLALLTEIHRLAVSRPEFSRSCLVVDKPLVTRTAAGAAQITPIIAE